MADGPDTGEVFTEVWERGSVVSTEVDVRPDVRKKVASANPQNTIFVLFMNYLCTI